MASGATVIATSSSDEKLKLASKLGAKHLINYKTTLDWGETVKTIVSGYLITPKQHDSDMSPQPFVRQMVVVLTM